MRNHAQKICFSSNSFPQRKCSSLKNIKVKFHNAEKTLSKNEGALTAIYLKKMINS